MAEVTLTASMRANLYSLQQTANLMGTVQQRLATGKKVNSALDNPNNYFTAQSLSNRASDIGSLLDGMGQAIQTIKAATQGIESAQKLIDQMKAVANSALSTAQSVASGARTEEAVAGAKDTQKLVTEEDNTQLLTNLKDNSTGLNLGIAVGGTLTMAYTGGASFTYTVTEKSTVKDLWDFVEGNAGGTTVAITNGAATVTNGQAVTLTLGGTVATKLGINGTIASSAAGTASTVAAATGPSKLADVATGASTDDTVSLLSLTNDSGSSLGIALGDTLTLQLGDAGQTLTFTVGGSNADNSTAGKDGGGITLHDLQVWAETQGDGTNHYDVQIVSGKLKVVNSNTLAATVGGTLAKELGIDGVASASGGSTTSATALYQTLQYGAPVVTSNTLLRDLTSVNGTLITNGQTQIGDKLTIENSTLGDTTIDITEGMTVGDLLTRINSIDSKLNVTLNSAGQFVVDNQTSGTVKFYGDGTKTNASTLFTNPNTSNSTYAANAPGAEVTATRVMYQGFSASGTSASGSSVIDANKSSQFDTLRSQLDELVQDSSYQGTNLISSTTNSPLTVTFNEKATGASKLVINSVDLTTSGLSIKAAAGNALGAWKNADSVRDALATLTQAATTLRNQAATFGYNLSTVQNRQDFANNMIATLKEGADKLTLADMNEEGANMLALQTRSQLGTQSLSLASQANQSVMRLFG